MSGDARYGNVFSTLMPPSSNRPGGVNVQFADGHTELASNHIDVRRWWAMGTRDMLDDR